METTLAFRAIDVYDWPAGAVRYLLVPLEDEMLRSGVLAKREETGENFGIKIAGAGFGAGSDG